MPTLGDLYCINLKGPAGTKFTEQVARLQVSPKLNLVKDPTIILTPANSRTNSFFVSSTTEDHETCKIVYFRNPTWPNELVDFLVKIGSLDAPSKRLFKCDGPTASGMPCRRLRFGPGKCFQHRQNDSP
jgi:hypothetical protein